VEAEPGRLARTTSIPLTSGRPLIRASGTWDELESRADALADAYLDLVVTVGAPDPDLGRRAAETFPFLVKIRAERPTAERRPRAADDVRPSDTDLFGAYHEAAYGEPAPPPLLALLTEVLEEAADAAS
jgi:hypothetical protein